MTIGVVRKMDSQHRHELEENDLESFLMNFKSFWARYGNAILIVVLLAAIGLFVKGTMSRRAAERHDQAWSGLLNATSPEVCASLAESYKDEPGYAALAYLKGADLFLSKALAPTTQPAETQPSGFGKAGEKSGGGAMEEAREMYQKVVDEPGVNLTVRLNAQLGLAAVAENLGEWGEAANIYQKVQEQSGNYPTMAAVAKSREGMLERIKRPVVFGPEPVMKQEGAATGAPPAESAAPLLPAPGAGLP
jgi:hypothetical protein